MASEASRSGASAGDSYIGSLISLTSKYEIRYEGVLYNINTEESSIGLVNVRSFGTEGRKKDGPQIPAGEKIYEYILFRGSDIKDLQVKSSPPAPPVQSAPIHNDPAIIQSHYSRPQPSSTSFPSPGSGTATEFSSNQAQGELPKSPFQGNLPLYQPGNNSLGSWASSPAPPTANGSGLAVPGPMPMYWQGYYAPTGTLPHLQQPPFMRPPPGLSVPQSLQQPLQYPAATGPLASGSQNLLEVPSPLMPTFGSISSSASVTTLPSESSSSSQMPPKATLTLASELVDFSSQNLPAGISSNPRLVNYQAMPRSVSSMVATSSSNQLETNDQTMPANVGSNSKSLSVPTNQNLRASQSLAVGLPDSSQVETSVPLVTPNRLLQPSLPVVSSSQPLQASVKDVEVKPQESKTKPYVEVKPQESKTKPLLSEPPGLTPVETKDLILPLPTPTHQQYPRPAARFTEDFDFNAMNEKFNKDEVWGHLGKSQLRDADEEEEEEDDEILDEDGGELLKSDKKPVYIKDDFFDTLSCNSLDRESRNGRGRTRFSEQMKIDTETFGDFSRYPNRGGGRGYRGGWARGSYYGRGYGYGGRGRGQAGPYRPF